MILLLGIFIGWVTMGISVHFILKYWNKKMFLDKPYKRKDKLFTDSIREGLKDKYIKYGN